MKYIVINMFSEKMSMILNKMGLTFSLNREDTAKKRPSYQARREVLVYLVNYLLPEFSDVEIHREPSGRPFLTSPNRHLLLPAFSASHSGPWMGCVVGKGNDAVGMDIEDMTIVRDYEKISAYAFSREENTYVSQTGKIGFYRLWTAKEAIAKTMGEGLTTALKIDLGVQLSNELRDHPFPVTVNGRSYELIQMVIEDQVMCTIARLI